MDLEGVLQPLSLVPGGRDVPGTWLLDAAEHGPMGVVGLDL